MNNQDYNNPNYKDAAATRREQERRVLSGIFYDRNSAENAYRNMRDRGYTDDDVNVMMSDQTREKWYPNNEKVEIEEGSKALEGTGVGSAVGGTLGAIIGGIAAIGTNVFLPGLGLLVAGPLVAALAGAGAGGLTGGLIGALVGAGIPEEHATLYEEGLKKDGVVFTVEPRNNEDAEYFQNDWRNNQGQHVNY